MSTTFRIMNRLTVILLAVWMLSLSSAALAFGPTAPRQEDDGPSLSPIRNALKIASFQAAIEAADTYLAGAGADRDEALYYKALALYHASQYEMSATTADSLLTEYANSDWFRKARFLKARAHIELRQFEEAETIYEDEANRLLSSARKHEIAGVLLRFADELSTVPDRNDLGAPPPDFQKAYNLYGQVLAMEIDRDFRDDVQFKVARTAQRGGWPSPAVTHYQQYLEKFDPDWLGPVGSAQRMRGLKKENPPPAGKHILESRLHLAESQLALGQTDHARQNLEDLLTLAPKAGTNDDMDQLRADSTWLIVKSFNMPSVGGHLAKAIAAARSFLSEYGDHPHAVEASWLIAQTYLAMGRHDDAIAAFEDFIAGSNYKLPAGDAATARLDGHNNSPAKLEADWRKAGLYSIAYIRHQQKNYAKAIERWQAYVNRYPNGPQWADAQRLIIDSEFMTALEAVANEKIDEANELFAAFLNSHPLDHRSPQVMYILGQLHAAEAEEQLTDTGVRAIGSEPAPDEPDAYAAARNAYRNAIAEWAKLISKYPNTEQSGLALYRTGLIYEENLNDLDNAILSYARLTWSSYAERARQRIAIMTRKQLTLTTDRTYRTNEAVNINVNVRNIEKLTIRQYFLDPEAYFRKTHSLTGVEALDIALIEPDKTWEVEIDGYGKYRPLEQRIDIPFDKSKPGVCIVNVAEDDLEATTLVVRSDIDMIARTSKRELLVYVQDMIDTQPAPGVKVLISDGKNIFASDETGEDGVLSGAFSELNNCTDIRVFVINDGHIASNTLTGLSGLGMTAGLSPKGYIYTDRSAYRPGQTVSARGAIRLVKNGSYVVPNNGPYVVRVTDARGRMLREEELSLSEFGTFNTEFSLDPAAPVGQYFVSAFAKKAPGQVFNGAFQVQQYQLQKMKLDISFAEDVVYRGDTVTVTISASYYWGEPVVEKDLQYTLPDGRMYTEKTDEEGKLEIEFDTTAMTPGTVLYFQAALPEESVSATGAVYLPAQGFDITVKASQDVVLAGEPFDVTVRTTTPDGKPATRKLTLFVLRRTTDMPHPVFAEVPAAASLRPHMSAEVTVEEHTITTDETTGEGAFRITLEEGGSYIVRAAGDDRFKQTVTAQSYFRVSDDTDATKLRMFADTDTLKVGEDATVRLHSRLDKGLALLTVEGETIISHRIIPLTEGYNPLTLDIDHEHFPNFALSVTAMDGRNLRHARREFTVQRQLNVKISPVSDTYKPGEDGRIELVVTDHLGEPVSAELSVALVDEALYAQYPDMTPNILSFFQNEARRRTVFRVTSSNGFSYRGQTRGVVKAFTAEEQRLVDMKKAEKDFATTRARMSYADLGLGDDLRNGAQARKAGRSGGGSGGGGGFGGGGGGGQGAMFGDADGDPNRMPMEALEARDKLVAGATFSYAALNLNGENGRPRFEDAGAGWWSPSIISDEHGRAVIDIPMPDTTTQWRIIARGVTAETLVGQAIADVVTRKDFFVEIKSPDAAFEGDQLRILARVHNLTDFKGPVELTCTVTSGSKRFTMMKETARVDKNGTTEVLFKSFEVPAVGEIEVAVTARAKDHSDALSRAIAVNAWGLEYAAHGGGIATNNATLTLTLPPNLDYQSQWLTVMVGPNLNQAVLDMALHDGVPQYRRGFNDGNGHTAPISPAMPTSLGSSAGGELLAVISALEYARSVNAAHSDRERLVDRARALVSSLVVTQRDDGGWTWRGGQQQDWSLTSTCFWSLVRASGNGMPVHRDTLAKAQAYLRKAYQQASTSDFVNKSIMLHALSEAGAAEFQLANSLYRERNKLSPLALAYTALTLANLDRNEYAGEVLDVLESKAHSTTRDSRAFTSWGKRPEGTPGGENPIDTTAISALALMKVRPTSKLIQPAIDFLLNERGCRGFGGGKSRGAAVAAISQYVGRGQFAEADFALTILVNGEEVRTIDRRADNPQTVFDIPAAMLAGGRNTIEFRINGRGRYAYAATMRGFSSEFKDPVSWRYPRVHSRRYYHSALTYRGRPISAGSSTQVSNLETGERTRVVIDLESSGRDAYLVVEEAIPAGAKLVAGSLSGNYTHHEVRDGKMFLYYPRGVNTGDIYYELVGYSTGKYRTLPTVIRDAHNPSRMRIGKAGALNVLAPGEDSGDPYNINDAERFALGKAYFDDGLLAESLEHLWPLFNRAKKYREREVAQMLLWVHTAEGFYDASRIVDTFEVLSVRHPDLTIPFDRILTVGMAYRDLGEFERAWLVFSATIDSSFLIDSGVAAILQDEGQVLGSIEYQENLWWTYPDTADVASSLFALSQEFYDYAPSALALAKAGGRIRAMHLDDGPHHGDGDDKEDGNEDGDKPTEAAMLAAAIRMLDSFLTLYPTSPLRDDAAFSMANAYLDLKDFERVVAMSTAGRDLFPNSEFESSFQYMIALGHFWQRDYEPALEAARVVADGKSRDRDFARYILGQIHHAQDHPAEAITWYQLVANLYPDASEAIDYFKEKRLALDEVSQFLPGETVELNIDYRNIAEAHLQVYKVDLMKLYLREKNLSRITKVNLAGIEPQLIETLSLGDGLDYADMERTATLDLTEDGAYLVICRGDNLFASGLVLITPLRLEVQEDATSGRVRANLIDQIDNVRPAGVHVKAIGSADESFRAGDTDLRGIFVADGLRGMVTAIARDKDARYAFYRGETWIGAPAADASRGRQPNAGSMEIEGKSVDYFHNIREQNKTLQRGNIDSWYRQRGSGNRGVEVQKAR